MISSAESQPSFLRLSLVGIIACVLLTACQTTNYHVDESDQRHFRYKRHELTDPAITYFGRHEWQGKTPVQTWPGSGLRFRTNATEILLELDDKKGLNFYNIFIDQNYSKPQIVDLEEGLQVIKIDLPAKTEDDNESVLVELFRRTEGQEGETLIKALLTNRSAQLYKAPPLPERRIEIYGDSITTGLGNAAPPNDPDDQKKDVNNFMAYGSIAARALDAQIMNTSQSGIGIMTSWFDYTMPDIYDQSNADYNNDSTWDFSQYPADLVVINLLQNDSWLIEKNLDPVPDRKDIIDAYADFVSLLLPNYPGAKFLLILGSMDAVAPGSRWPNILNDVEDKLTKNHPERIFDTLIFPYTGYQKHPRIPQHQKNAELFVAKARKMMGW